MLSKYFSRRQDTEEKRPNTEHSELMSSKIYDHKITFAKILEKKKKIPDPKQ